LALAWINYIAHIPKFKNDRCSALLGAVELEDSLAKKDTIANLPKVLHTTQPLAMTNQKKINSKTCWQNKNRDLPKRLTEETKPV
jgi:hypothetical protein